MPEKYEVNAPCISNTPSHEGPMSMNDRQQSDGIANQSEQLKELKSAALEAAGDAVAITDRDGVIEWVNTEFEQLTGYSSKDAIGQGTRLLKSGVHPPDFYKNMWETILGGLRWQGELINRRKDGTIYP